MKKQTENTLNVVYVYEAIYVAIFVVVNPKLKNSFEETLVITMKMRILIRIMSFN